MPNAKKIDHWFILCGCEKMHETLEKSESEFEIRILDHKIRPDKSSEEWFWEKSYL